MYGGTAAASAASAASVASVASVAIATDSIIIAGVLFLFYMLYAVVPVVLWHCTLNVGVLLQSTLFQVESLLIHYCCTSPIVTSCACTEYIFVLEYNT